MTSHSKMPSWALAPTIPSPFVADLFRYIALDKRRRAALRKRSGLTAASLDDAAYRFTPQQFGRALRMVISEASDESFGLFARPVPVGAYGRLLRLLAYCPDLATALREASGFYQLFDNRSPWRTSATSQAVEIGLTPRTAAQAGSLLYTHMALLTLWHTMNWLSGSILPLQQVMLPDIFRAYSAKSRFLFGRAPLYGQGAALLLPAGTLAAPVTRSAGETRAFLRQAFFGLIGPGPQGSLESRLRVLLAASTPFTALRETAAAQELGISRQTLAKRLAALGTSFQGIRDEMRRDRACVMLTRSDLGFAEIAEALSYSEPSAFQRAFKQWTGMPPGEYRKRHRVVNRA